MNEAMRALWEQAEGNVDAFQKSVEAWFDDAMDRLGGVYKRRAQLVNFLAGLVIAVLLNIDALKLAGVLYYDPRLASSVGDLVSTFVASAEATDKGRPEDFVCIADQPPGGATAIASTTTPGNAAATVSVGGSASASTTAVPASPPSIASM